MQAWLHFTQRVRYYDSSNNQTDAKEQKGYLTMTNADTLVARMRASVDRISAAADNRNDTKEVAKLKSHCDTLESQNQSLSQELERLKAQRLEDVRELDKLLSELKPLIEEAS